MSTENLLRAQSAERLSESSHSSGVYFRTNSRQSRQRPQRKEGLDNPGFEEDFLENSRREHSSSNSVLKRSGSVPQVMEGNNIDDAGRKQVNSTRRSNDGPFKKIGLQRQRPKTTSGQDLRRKAFINSLKLRRARSASYLVVPDENCEDVFRKNRVSQESSRNETNERSIRTPQNSQITRERSLQNLSKSVQNTEKENSHLREYSRRLSAALEERAQLTETLHVLSRSVSLVTDQGYQTKVKDKGREQPTYPGEERPHSAEARLSAENNTPQARGNSFEELAASPSQENRRLPETPLSLGQRKRGEQESRRKPNGQTERRQKPTEELSVSAHCDKADKERKKRALAKLAEELWRCHTHGETFQTNEIPRGDTMMENENNGQASADWRRANNPDVRTGPLDQNETNRAKLRRAAFRKQLSFQDGDVTSALERRLSRDCPAEKGKSRDPNKGATTQLGETKTARSNSRHEELDRRALHRSSTEDQYDNLLGSQEHDVRRPMPLHQQPLHERYPGTTLDGYMPPRTQNNASRRHQRGREQKERQQDGDNLGDVDKEGVNRESKLPQRVGSQDYNGRRTSPLRTQQENLSSDNDYINNNHVGMRSREGDSSCYNGCFRQDNVVHAPNTEQSSTTKAATGLPSYDISLMRKRPQGDGYKTAELADAFMATDDEEERRELQRRAASEAAVLRREASNLLWKAMDLERICDQNARVRHVLMPH